MKSSMLPILLLTLGAGTVSAQRAPRGERVYVAPTNDNVFSSEEESAGTIPVILIYVNNRSSVPITVYSASLRDCENVKQSCAPVRLNRKIRPGGREVILRVQAKNEFSGMRYRYTFGWRADSSSIVALQTLATAGNAEAQARLDANADARAAERRQVGAGDIWLDDEAITTLGAKIAGIRAEPDSVMVREGRGFLLRDVRVMAIDSAGQLLGRVSSGVRWTMPGNTVLQTRADTIYGALAGRARIVFRFTTPAREHEAALAVIVLPDSTP